MTVAELSRQLGRIEGEINRRLTRIENKVDGVVFVSAQTYEGDQRRTNEQFTDIKGELDKIASFRVQMFLALIVAFIGIISQLVFIGMGR